jgi:hypothetical protein
MNNLNYLAEFVFTIFFSFALFWTDHYLIIGLTLAFLIYINPDGAYNPGLALILYNTGKISKKDLTIYIILEILGFLIGYEIYERIILK